MYRLEEYKNKTTINDYLENYVDVSAFLEYCKMCKCYGKVWSCPPYDFRPEDYWRRHKYIYIKGTKIIFEQTVLDKNLEKEQAEELINQVFFKEREILSEKMLTLEKEHPGSVSLSAGSCHICVTCARLRDKTCLYPGEMRYSIESLGGNVEKTAGALLGIELKWLDEKLPEYVTMVSGFLTDNPDVEL